MAIIRAKVFRGYSSRPDDLINNLEFAQDCNDVVIHKGDICNLPYPKKLHNIIGFDINSGFLETSINNIKQWYRFHIGGKKLQFVIDKGNAAVIVTLVNIEAKIGHPGLGLEFEEDDINATLKGTIVQLGNWLYINCNTFKHPGLLSVPNIQGRMLRITTSFVPLTFSIKYGLIGIDSPIKAVASTSSGSYTGSFDFAFTFVTNFKNINDRDTDPHNEFAYYDNNVKLGPDDIESNAASLGTNVSHTSKKLLIKITLPPFLPALGFEGPINDNPILVGVYARAVDEEFYRFAGYWPASLSHLPPDINPWIANITIDQTITQHIDRTPPLSGHSVPYNGTAMVFYKDRIYRNTSPLLYAISDGSTVDFLEVNSNLLQVSPSTEFETLNSPYALVDPTKAEQDGFKIANYRDTTLSRTVGSDNNSITGLIVFLGQLIIFKRRETYHLTNDITIGTIRSLWPKLGCVNINGGRGYVVAGDTLFFVSHDGVYAFSGQDKPIKISSAIEEDLLELSRITYGYAILSVDHRYEHLYLTFLGSDTAFVFHYGESGGWTKATSAHEVLIDPDNEYYYNTSNNLQQLGTISSESAVNLPRTPSWKSGIITINDGVRNKKWNELTVETQDTLAASGGTHDITIRNSAGTALITKTGQVVKRTHLGVYTDGIKIDLELTGTHTTSKPFRINGMSITGELRGRR